MRFRRRSGSTTGKNNMGDMNARAQPIQARVRRRGISKFFKNIRFLYPGVVLFSVIIMVFLFQVQVSKEEMNNKLLKAAIEGKLGEVKNLLKLGADINTKDKSNWTPLMCACSGQNNKIAELLIKAGADVKAKSIHGVTALVLASDKKVSELLIKAGADVNAKDKDGITVLMGASSKKPEVTELLLKYKVDINARADEGMTALSLALHNKGPKNAELLIKAGADVNIKDENGTPPLILATINKNIRLVELIINKGAEVNAKSKEGNTARDMANLYGLKDIIDLLEEHGAIESQVPSTKKKELGADIEQAIQERFKKGSNLLNDAINSVSSQRRMVTDESKIISNCDQAEGEFRQILRLDDTADKAHYGNGLANVVKAYLGNKEAITKGISELEDAIGQNRKNGAAHYYLGYLYHTRNMPGDRLQAHSEFMKAIKYNFMDGIPYEQGLTLSNFSL